MSSCPADVSMRFADGIVLGVLEGSTGFVLVNPPPEYTLNADEQLILLRPTNMTQVRSMSLAAAYLAAGPGQVSCMQ